MMHLERASERAPLGLAELLRGLGDGESGFGGTAFGRGESTLEGFLRSCVTADPARTLVGFVPQTVYWMIEGEAGRVVGMVRVRHRLNETLLRSGGHIGYYVDPAYRGRGYATRGLRLALDRLRAMGVQRALLTVALGNEASRRVILANGGTLDGHGVQAETGEVMERYWIELSATPRAG